MDFELGRQCDDESKQGIFIDGINGGSYDRGCGCGLRDS